jgi:hypothetical protein
MAQISPGDIYIDALQPPYTLADLKMDTTMAEWCVCNQSLHYFQKKKCCYKVDLTFSCWRTEAASSRARLVSSVVCYHMPCRILWLTVSQGSFPSTDPCKAMEPTPTKSTATCVGVVTGWRRSPMEEHSGLEVIKCMISWLDVHGSSLPIWWLCSENYFYSSRLAALYGANYH